MTKKPKSLVIPGDPDNAWARQVAGQITDYLKKDLRKHRTLLALNDSEHEMAKQAAKIQKVPVSTILRGCAMYGLSIFLMAKEPVAK